MVSYMAADSCWWGNDCVTGFAGRHKCIQVCECARANTEFRELGTENITGKCRSYYFNFFNCVKPNFVFISRVSERCAGAHAR